MAMTGGSMTIIEFAHEHPEWFFAYLFVVCCAVTSCFYSAFGVRDRSKSKPE